MKFTKIAGAVLMLGGLAALPLTASASAPPGLTPPGVTLSVPATAAHGTPAIGVRPRDYKGPTTAGTGSNMTYHGGQVQSNVRVHILFWGLWWNSGCSGSQGNGQADESYLYNYWHGMGTGSDGLSNVQTQYSDSSGHRPRYPVTSPGHVFYDWYALCSDPPQSATDGQLAAVAQAQAVYLNSHGTPIGRSDQIIVVSPSGTNPGGGFGNYCAYHNWTNGPNGLLSWTNMPYLPDQGVNCGAGFLPSGPDPALQGWSIVSGHEYAESATDPFLNAWYDTSLSGEIGDKCAWTGIFTETLPTGHFVQQPEWSNVGSSCRQSDYVHISNPGNRSNPLGTHVALFMHASSPFSRTWIAYGLPKGLVINHTTGEITGTLTARGTYNVAVRATEPSTTVTSEVEFTWTVS